MIKQLITDIAYDNITLSQALTRAKLIESKIRNDNFKNWLKNELEGYDYDSSALPDYRRISSPMFLIAEFPFGRTQEIEVSIPDDFSDETMETVYFHRILEAISSVEEQIQMLKEPKGYINLPITQVEALSILYNPQVKSYGGVIRSGHRVVGRINYINVIDLTKQKLLDTLMELNEEFPNLENDFENTKSNNDKVQNIVNNNIYGNNNPMNIATGVNVALTSNLEFKLSDEQIQKLSDLNVDSQDIEKLSEILKEKNSSGFGKKILSWLSSVSASVAARGFYDKIPEITEFTHQLL